MESFEVAINAFDPSFEDFLVTFVTALPMVFNRPWIVSVALGFSPTNATNKFIFFLFHTFLQPNNVVTSATSKPPNKMPLTRHENKVEKGLVL